MVITCFSVNSVNLNPNFFISESTSSSELIHPFLLGRDIKPYQTGKPKQWIILIPKGFTIKNRLIPGSFNVQEPMHRYGYLDDDIAWRWFSAKFPAIARHLMPFKEKAESGFRYFRSGTRNRQAYL
jgi:adenine-specific DNA-methyltransferase